MASLSGCRSHSSYLPCFLPFLHLSLLSSSPSLCLFTLFPSIFNLRAQTYSSHSWAIFSTKHPWVYLACLWAEMWALRVSRTVWKKWAECSRVGVINQVKRLKDAPERVICFRWEWAWAVRWGEVAFTLCWSTTSHAEMKSQNKCLAKVFSPWVLLRFGEAEKCDGAGICLCSVVVIYEEECVSVWHDLCVCVRESLLMCNVSY